MLFILVLLAGLAAGMGYAHSIRRRNIKHRQGGEGHKRFIAELAEEVRATCELKEASNALEGLENWSSREGQEAIRRLLRAFNRCRDCDPEYDWESLITGLAAHLR